MSLNIDKLKERLKKFEAEPRRKKPTPKPEPKRMSYYTYAYLKALVDREKVKMEQDFQRALIFIPSEPFRSDRQSGLEKAHKIFSDEWAKLNAITDELHLAAQSMYKDHPNPAMREFWGLKE